MTVSFDMSPTGGEPAPARRVSARRSGADADVERSTAARSLSDRIASTVASVLIVAITLYRWALSPLLGPCCRFEPSCSRYMALCIERRGPLRGVWLGLCRLARCHPFCAGGHDPPPEMTS